MKSAEILRYPIFFAIFVFLFFIEFILGLNVAAFAFFMALVYSKQNALVLSPLFIASKIIFTIELTSILLTLTPIAVILIVYFIHYKLQKNINLIHINIYHFISMIPLITLLIINDPANILQCIIIIVVSMVLLNTSIVLLFAILIKHLTFKLSKEEVFSGCVWLIVFGLGLKALSIKNFDVYYMVLSIVCILMIFIHNKITHLLTIFMGIGAAIYLKSPDVIGLSLGYGLVSALFKKEFHWFTALALTGIDITYRVFFNMNITIYTIIPPLLGGLIVSFIPNHIKIKLSTYLNIFKEKTTSRVIINRDRKLLSDKLLALSNVFTDISDVLLSDIDSDSTMSDINFITNDSFKRCCKICPYVRTCHDGLNENSDIIIRGLVSATIESGKATILDAPPIVTSRCRRINALITSVNDSINKYTNRQSAKTEFNTFKNMLSNQICGVSEILNSLSIEFKTLLFYDRAIEDKLISELNAVNIATGDVVVYSTDKKVYSAVIAVNEKDSDNLLIIDIVSLILGVPMMLAKKESTIAGMCALRFEKMSKFQVVYGYRSRAASVDGINGDSHKAIRLSNDKVMLILSDGMGHGHNASINSNMVLNLIESFYRAGFEYTTVANTLSSVLSIKNNEEFNAIDIALINTVDGCIDFIKVGARESFIIYHGVVETIECGSLPLGILEETPEPYIERKNLISGSFIVMATDGIIDTIGVDEINDLLSSVNTGNPDTVAEMIIRDYDRIVADKSEHKDDASVLVAKIFETPK
ncbi:MAG: SpoIIE family protein phosphatase [Christensenellaceae bacterium]|jgi:stage II sporulation protein E|nr:SpoIIE family protein phosphatase [Christensenellaceae bacterium]